MPKVPILQPSVATQPTAVPEPQVYRPPEEAFGGDIANAKAALGQQVQRTAQVASQRLIELQQRDAEQQALDLSTKFQTELQTKLHDTELDENGRPKGFLSRQLGQAKGSIPEFDAVAQELKGQYMENVQSPELRVQMNKVLDTHLSSAREQVIHNEATQREADFKNSLDSNMKTNVASAATLSEPVEVLKAIRLAQAQATGGYMHLGMDENTILYNNKALASEMVKSAVMGNLEDNPKKAQAILTAMTPLMNASDIQPLQKTIDGKMLYERIKDVTAVADNMRLSDGLIDRGRVNEYVRSLKLPADEEYSLISHVDHLAMVDYSITMKKRQDAQRDFTNDLVTSQSQGIPYDQALKIPAKYGWDATSIANMQAEVTKIYASPEEKFTTWISRQPQATQGAWAEATNTVKQKYGNSVATIAGTQQKMADAALTELKQDCLGKSADQIRDIVKTKLDKVTIGPGAIWGNLWPDKETAWKADANLRQGISEANMLLEKDYGADRVGQAKTFLATSRDKDGRAIPTTPANIKRVLDEWVRTKQKPR